MIICYFGDSLTLGYGDPAGLSWPGRVSGTLHTLGVDVTSYNLGIRKETTLMLADRWKQEAALRQIKGMESKLIFSFGVADVVNNVADADSLAAAKAILTEAGTMGDVLLIGPTPMADETKCGKVAALSGQLGTLCETLSVPFLPVIDAMRDDPVYAQALTDGDSVHPTAPGYAALARYILQSEEVRDFFGLE